MCRKRLEPEINKALVNVSIRNTADYFKEYRYMLLTFIQTRIAFLWRRKLRARALIREAQRKIEEAQKDKNYEIQARKKLAMQFLMKKKSLFLHTKETEDKKKKIEDDRINEENQALNKRKNKFKGKRDPLAGNSMVSDSYKIPG
jgi:hypothetical protein